MNRLFAAIIVCVQGACGVRVTSTPDQIAITSWSDSNKVMT